MFLTVPPISRFSLGRDRPILGMVALTEECCYKILREHFWGRLNVFASRIQVIIRARLGCYEKEKGD